ncbi:MAG TPA: hypothetical protein VJI73_02040 [Candidatus Paceibacterota bacterium]
MKKELKTAFKFIFVLTAVIYSLPATAQLPGTGATEDLSVRVSPESPGAHTEVTIEIESFSSDLRKSDIQWFENGVRKTRGVGLANFTFTTGGLGTVSNIRVVVTTSAGQTIAKDFVFRIARVDVLWSADSYTPAFFPGKPLPTSEAHISAYALPIFLENGKRLAPSSLMYEWSLNFEKQDKLSGIGKNSFTFTGPNSFGTTNIDVRVSTLDNRIISRGSVHIEPESSEVYVYVLDPLLGPDYRKPVNDNYELREPELSLLSEPFYFPLSHKSGKGLRYEWALNGKAAETSPATPQILTLRQRNTAGQAAVSINITDPFDNLVSAAKSFFVEFGSNLLTQ